jgi:hypothetical protein
MAIKSVTVPARHKGLLAAYITPEEAGILTDMFHKETDPPKAGPGGLLMYDGEDAREELKLRKAAEKAAGRKLTGDEKSMLATGGAASGGVSSGSDSVSTVDGATRFGESIKDGSYKEEGISLSTADKVKMGLTADDEVSAMYDYDAGRYEAVEMRESWGYEAGDMGGMDYDDARGGWYIPTSAGWTKEMDPYGGSSEATTVLPFPGATSGGAVSGGSLGGGGSGGGSGGGGGGGGRVTVPSGPSGYRAQG